MRTVNNPSGRSASSIAADEFLADAESANVIPWSKPSGAPVGLATRFIHFGHGQNPLEVVVAEADAAPKSDEMRRLWKTRANKVAPVLLVVLHQGRASALGTSGEPAPLHDLDIAQVERICAAALAEHDRHAAAVSVSRLVTALAKDGLSSGLLNSGLFASHELREGVPLRADWAQACERSSRLLGLSDIGLVKALGYDTAPRGSTAILLAHEGEHRAVAVLLTDDETFDRPSDRFGAMSPVAHAIAAAQDEKVAWVIVLRGTQIRLYPVDPTIGVGRKGQAETYTELDLALLTDGDSGYLELLFAAEALRPGGTVHQILAASSNFVVGLSERLRDRVYVDVVPDLAVAVARHMEANGEDDLDEAYHRTLLILFRMLFLAYAEDRGLLPYGRNPRYDRHAVKTLAKTFTDTSPEFDTESTDLWDQLLNLWDAIDLGKKDWDVPAYNGGLFSKNTSTHPSGAAIAAMRITDAEIGPALRSLLVDLGNDGTQGPVDFRSLSVREFGTIYEGLLESSLSVAPTDLTLDKDGTFIPAKPGKPVAVAADQIYFHNASGQRKSTGSYFTKSFAVEHLLDTALEPALSAHLAKVKALLDAGESTSAYETFFDFRVADLAMGSAHFLVAAIDRIESRFTAFLTKNPIPAVADELGRLDKAAREHLGDQENVVEIEPSMLLRRQIARRCIYGLDLNLVAVELARLAIWIHTFVPGLPMSSLEHNLIRGNSLTGIATLEEALVLLEPGFRSGTSSLFAVEIEERLESARDVLSRVARSDEARKAEVRHAAQAHRKALDDSVMAKHLFDAAIGIRLGILQGALDVEGVVASAVSGPRATELQGTLSELNVTHLPYQFPEVFLKEKPGFDVVVGNPPWEKVRWEAAPFWVGYFPGLMAIRGSARDEKIEELRASHPVAAQQEIEEQRIRSIQQALFTSSFTLRGGTHLELAQLMLERSLTVLGDRGHLGVVLPRQSLVLAGWKRLRKHLLDNATLGIVQGRNQGEWLFEDVHESYAVVLLSGSLSKQGPASVWVAASAEEVQAATPATAISLTRAEIAEFSDADVIPWFNDAFDRAVFDKLRTFPRLAAPGGWITGRHDARWDFRGSGPDRALAKTQDGPGYWKVLMTAHVDAYAFDFSAPVKQWVDPVDAVRKNKGISPDGSTVVATGEHPIVLVRHPSRSNDTRTLIATALPESGIVHNKGYIHSIMHSPDSSAEAVLALLGLVNSVTLDWWARRFVDRHVTAPVINQLPLPNWDTASIERASRLVAALLARNGYQRLAGGIVVSDDHPELTDTDILARLEVMVLDGFGLSNDDFSVISRDFSAKGLPLELMSRIESVRTTR